MSLSSVKSETALRSWLFSRSRSLRRFTCSVFSPRRFVQGYRDSIDWMYAGDEVLKAMPNSPRSGSIRLGGCTTNSFPKARLAGSGERARYADGRWRDIQIPEPLTKEWLAEMIEVPAPVN